MYKNRNNCNNSIQYENKQKTNIFLLKSIDKYTSISYNKAKIRDKKTKTPKEKGEETNS